jgi:penicillin G amidase
VGDKGLDIDKFSRTIGLQKQAEANWETLDDHQKHILQSYADGINDYIESLKIGGFLPGLDEILSDIFGATSGNLLPPEFYALGVHNKIEPWSPVDPLGLSCMMSTSLMWDWALDLHREILKIESDEMAKLAE